MKIRFRPMASLTTLFLLPAVILLVGCATGHRHLNMSELTGVKVEVLPAKNKYVEIVKVKAYRDGNELLVIGEAKKKGPIFTTYKGHIDIAVVHPDKKADLGMAEYVHHPSREVTSSFDVHFPVPAGQGIKVFMVFHPVNGNDSEHSAAVELLLARAK